MNCCLMFIVSSFTALLSVNTKTTLYIFLLEYFLPLIRTGRFNKDRVTLRTGNIIITSLLGKERETIKKWAVQLLYS